MNGRKILTRIISCLQLVWLLFPVQAQQYEGWIDVAEETLNRKDDSRFSEEHCEEQQELLFYPINLNKATQVQLESSGLFTSYQANSIIHYRETYGELLSVYELASIPCFRRERLEEQTIYLTVNETTPIKLEKPPRSTVLLYAGKSYSNTETQPVYPGSLWKTSLRIKKGIGRKGSLGVAYEKDSGEKAVWGYRPEHLSGYLEWRGNRIVQQVMIGTFRINNGMGLIQGAGLMHTPVGIQSRPLLLTSLKPYAGAGESIIHQGAACKLNLGFMKAVLWASFQPIDLSLGNFPPLNKNTDWSDHIRTSGYHRTPTEQSGRNLAYLGSTGVQAEATIGRLNLGIQYSSEINGLTGKGKDSLQYFDGPMLYNATSVQWQWRLNKLELYGEFEPGAKNSSALQAGSRIFINDFLSGALQVHWYGSSHRETFASAYASGSHLENEKGVLLLIHAEPFLGVRADVTAELFEYPAPRKLVKVPSSGFRFSLALQNGSQETLQWRLRMVNESRQQTPSSSEQRGIRPLSNIQNNRIDGRVVYDPIPWFTWQSRLVISYTPGNLTGYGHTALQQVTVRLKKRLKCTTQLVMYHVPSWDNRIYLYEPGLYQQFRFPVYSGTGNKISMVTSVKPGKGITLEVRGSVIRESKMKRWEADMQLRLNF